MVKVVPRSVKRIGGSMYFSVENRVENGDISADETANNQSELK